MKPKLTLNIDDKIVAQAKIESEKRNVSPSSVEENYLDHFSKSGSKKAENPGTSLLERIRKYTRNAAPIPEDFNYKKAMHGHLDEKYGL